MVTRAMAMSWLRLGGFALVGGCGLSAAFPCDVDADCIDGARQGLCQPDGWCSFPDDGCGSGQRYGTHAGDGLAGLCVDEPGTTGGVASDAGSTSGFDDPSLTSLDGTGRIDSGGDTSTSGDGTTSNATAVTSTPTSDDDATQEGPPPDSGASDGSTDTCGNGIIDANEACDGQDVDGQDCESLDAGTGVVSCSASCELDLSMCVPVDDEPDYGPCVLDTDCHTQVCHVFAGNGTCLPPCMTDDECPPLAGGMAPFCSADDFCLIPCTVEADCPEPMRCDPSPYGDVCLW